MCCTVLEWMNAWMPDDWMCPRYRAEKWGEVEDWGAALKGQSNQPRPDDRVGDPRLPQPFRHFLVLIINWKICCCAKFVRNQSVCQDTSISICHSPAGVTRRKGQPCGIERRRAVKDTLVSRIAHFQMLKGHSSDRVGLITPGTLFFTLPSCPERKVGLLFINVGPFLFLKAQYSLLSGRCAQLMLKLGFSHYIHTNYSHFKV